MKRVWYRGRGRRDMKLRRSSHITIVVDEREGAR
jgi:ribosomal protein L22